MSLSLESPAFTSNAVIPSQFTCEGADHSPPLAWQDSASNTLSYVLIVNDPDAPGGSWDHWVLFNIPPNIKQLAEAAQVPIGATSIKNSWGGSGYRGPCPPSGTHRYLFTLYALDTKLSLKDTASTNDILQAMKGHVIAQSELVGRYQKK